MVIELRGLYPPIKYPSISEKGESRIRIFQSALKRLEIPAGAKPARQRSLQPESVRGAEEATKLSGPSMAACGAHR